MATETVPLGAGTSTITYSYDVAARRTQMQVTGQTAVTYGYDDANRLTSVTQGTNAVSFEYDVASRRTKATLPNLVTIDYAYNNGNELTTLTYRRNTTTTLGTLGYTYDAAGRRLTMTGSLARVALPPALASATYDAANRLTNWAGTALTYDFNGNLVNDGVQTYTWDVRDRLTGVSGGTATASFVYDPLTRRASKTINGAQSGTLYDGFSEVHTTAGAAVTSTLLNGPGLDERYARTAGSTTTVILPDALGSTVNLIGPTGTTTAAFTYEPYGVATKTGTDDTQYRYTGREDDGMGLMYYRARYYHPRFGRFVSEDPIGLAGGYNLFGYVDGSPTNAVDPTGEFWQAAGILFAGWTAWSAFDGLTDMWNEAQNKKVMDAVKNNEIARASRGSVNFDANAAQRAQSGGLEAVAGSAVGGSQATPGPVAPAKRDWHEIVRDIRVLLTTKNRGYLPETR